MCRYTGNDDAHRRGSGPSVHLTCPGVAVLSTRFPCRNCVGVSLRTHEAKALKCVGLLQLCSLASIHSAIGRSTSRTNMAVAANNSRAGYGPLDIRSQPHSCSLVFNPVCDSHALLAQSKSAGGFHRRELRTNSRRRSRCILTHENGRCHDYVKGGIGTVSCSHGATCLLTSSEPGVRPRRSF